MEIIAVKHDPSHRQFEAAQEVDGNLYHLIMPDDVLETRAAEYQINPAETDLLLDIVLYEPYVDEEEYGVPLLFRAATVEEARTQHTARVQAVKQRMRPTPNAWRSTAKRAGLLRDKGVDPSWVSAITDDALAPIRQHHRMDAEVLAEKALLVRANVERFQQARANAARRTDADRAAAVRQARLMLEGSADKRAAGTH